MHGLHNKKETDLSIRISFATQACEIAENIIIFYNLSGVIRWFEGCGVCTGFSIAKLQYSMRKI